MRRLHALLMTAGLAAAPAVATAAPVQARHPAAAGPHATFEKLEWSMGKGRLGLMVMGMTPELRTHLGAARDRGVLVARVEKGSPAAAAGIEVGDVITAVRGKPVEDAADVIDALGDAHKGARVDVDVVRDGRSLDLHATMADDPGISAGFFDELEKEGPNWLHDMMRPFFDPDVGHPFGRPS